MAEEPGRRREATTWKTEGKQKRRSSNLCLAAESLPCSVRMRRDSENRRR